MRVTTWNVLHRVHAVNWDEAPVTAHPDERARIAGITATIRAWLDEDPDMIVCLQEVSGDQLASLRSALPRFDVHTHRYARVPRVRLAARSSDAALDDATEHLVVIAGGPSMTLEGRSFDSDSGKGLLAVRVHRDLREGRGEEPVTVIATHVSFGDRAAAQLASLAATARRSGARSILAGDFNAPVATVREGLGEPIAISDLAGQRATRIATVQHGGKTIDHVAVVGGVIEEATVLDGRLLSDHQPVVARVRLQAPSG